MAAITVRNLDDGVQQRLKVRAAAHGRSMEAEAREILTAAVSTSSMIVDWVDAASRHGVELELPQRSAPRELDLS
ncbi:FitA-like ribbon-helix-helix domain-containing protein [Microbacterium sp. B2969]|uniref:FitA-like ribbon-helix-helix domain-containing protein n=1 Tax=Microbacterium alkaliflavum TaxID=3248839 RepID=A0ABW7QBI6_9MICO